MPVTKAKRLAILTQLKKVIKDQTKIATFESFLDDNSPEGDELQNMFYARSEATKLVQEVAKEKEALAQSQAKLATDYSNLQTWQSKAEQEILTAKQQASQQANLIAEKAKAKLNELRTKAQSESLLMSDFNFDLDLPSPAINNNLSSTQLNNSNNNPNNLNNPPITKKESPAMPNNTPPAEDAGKLLIKGITGIYSLANKHKALFGADLDIDGLVDQSLAENRDYNEIYNELYNPQAKRAELDAAALDVKVNQMVEAKLAERLSSLDPTGQSGHQSDFSKIVAPTSPVFTNLRTTAKDDPMYRNDPRFSQSQQPNSQQPNQDPNIMNPPIVQVSEDMEIAKEFMGNLLARENK